MTGVGTDSPRDFQEYVLDTRKRLVALERRQSSGGGSSGGGSYQAIAGAIMAWGSDAIPSGWLLCNGQAVQRAAFPELFAAIGVRFGAGDGASTFNVPDYRGRTDFGLDSTQTEFDVIGEKGGAKTVTLDVTQMPAHQHQTSHDRTAAPFGVQGSGAYSIPSAGGYTSMAAGGTSIVGGGLPHNNLPPYITMNFLISTGAGVGGGGTNVPALPNPATIYGVNGTVSAANGVWQDISGATWTITLTRAMWVLIDFQGIILTADTNVTYGMIGVAASGALVLAPDQDQTTGAVNNFGLTPFTATSTGSNVAAHGTRALLLPAGTTTLTMQKRRNTGTVTPSVNYPMMTVTPMSWAGAPGVITDGTRGTTAQRDAIYGIPTNDLTRAALANQQIVFYNTDKGYSETYYAVSGTVGATGAVLRVGSASGWYPEPGAPIYATLRNVANQTYSTAVDIIFTIPPVAVHGITCSTTSMTLPVAGDYEFSATMVSSGSPAGYADMRLLINGTQLIAQSGTQFPHTNAYSRADIVSFIYPCAINSIVKLTATPSSPSTIAGTSAYLRARYISPPFAS